MHQRKRTVTKAATENEEDEGDGGPVIFWGWRGAHHVECDEANIGVMSMAVEAHRWRRNPTRMSSGGGGFPSLIRRDEDKTNGDTSGIRERRSMQRKGRGQCIYKGMERESSSWGCRRHHVRNRHRHSAGRKKEEGDMALTRQTHGQRERERVGGRKERLRAGLH